MERDPVGPLVDGGRDVARGGQPGVEDERRDQGGLGRVERGELDLLGDPLRHQPGTPLAKARPAWHVLRPVVAGQQEGPVARPTGELTDDLEAHVVGPLQVLEGQHRGTRQRGQDQLDRLHHEASPLGVFGGEDGLVELEQRRAECRELRHPDHRAGEVEDGRGRDIVILRCDGSLDGGKAATRGLAADGAEQAGLADAGRAGQQEELATPREDVLETAIGEVEQVVAPDQERAADRPWLAFHRRSVGPGATATSVVRPMAALS